MALPPELLRRVSRDEVNALPIRRYEGAVSVIAAPHELAVARLLAEAHIVKAGVGMADDLKGLKKLVAFHEKSIADLGTMAQRQGLQQSGVRNLAGLFLGFR